MSSPIHDRLAMLSGMTPVLDEDTYIFCSVRPDVAQTLFSDARGIFIEEEGTTLVLSLERAAALGFDTGMPMRLIVLRVHSALDGVGLTAAVATALAEEDIPCNVIAAFHHDHIFVPGNQAEKALLVLQDVQKRAQSTQ
ncbi:ACT domain-containing protein [Nitratireductor rhodophyticola]